MDRPRRRRDSGQDGCDGYGSRCVGVVGGAGRLFSLDIGVLPPVNNRRTASTRFVVVFQVVVVVVITIFSSSSSSSSFFGEKTLNVPTKYRMRKVDKRRLLVSSSLCVCVYISLMTLEWICVYVYVCDTHDDLPTVNLCVIVVKQKKREVVMCHVEHPPPPPLPPSSPSSPIFSIFSFFLKPGIVDNET